MRVVELDVVESDGDGRAGLCTSKGGDAISFNDSGNLQVLSTWFSGFGSKSVHVRKDTSGFKKDGLRCVCVN